MYNSGMTPRLRILLAIFLVLSILAFTLTSMRANQSFVQTAPDQGFGPASAYGVDISGPAEMILDAGEHAFRFTVANTGDSLDDYAISATTTVGQIDVSAVPPVLRVPAHEVRGFVIGVRVPEGVLDGTTGKIRVGAISVSTPLAFDAAYADVRIVGNATPTPAYEIVLPK